MINLSKDVTEVGEDWKIGRLEDQRIGEYSMVCVPYSEFRVPWKRCQPIVHLRQLFENTEVKNYKKEKEYNYNITRHKIDDIPVLELQ